MSAAQKNITINIGKDFFLTVNHKNSDGTPINLLGASFFARLRETYDSPIALADFVCEVQTPVSNGQVIISLSDEITALLERTKITQYVWDYNMIDAAGFIHEKLYGNVYVRGNASREDET